MLAYRQSSIEKDKPDLDPWGRFARCTATRPLCVRFASTGRHRDQVKKMAMKTGVVGKLGVKGCSHQIALLNRNRFAVGQRRQHFHVFTQPIDHGSADEHAVERVAAEAGNR